MLFLLSLLVASVFLWAFHKLLKKKPVVFYLAAVLITLLTVLVDTIDVPVWLENYVLDMLKRGTFPTALWVIIMFTGALKNGSKLIKLLMPIRGELSIFAAILTLGHNIVYGKVYFVNLFTHIERMPKTQIVAAVLTLVMLALLIPLTVTSFKTVRQKMKPKRWKNLQRFAYLYYALLYVHIMLVTYPSAMLGKVSSVTSVLVYTAVFLFYLVWRVRKYLILKKKAGARATTFGASLALIFGMGVCLCSVLPHVLPEEDLDQTDDSVILTQDEHLESDETSSEPNAETDKVANLAASGETEVELVEPNLDLAEVFEGSAYGYDGEIFVKIYVIDGTIVKITGYTEESDEFYYERASKKVIPAILSAQSYDVDAVSGATYSSDAIMDAVHQAMKKAGITE